MKDAKERQAAEEAASKAAVAEAFKRVTPELAAAAEPLMARSYELLQQVGAAAAGLACCGLQSV